MTPQCQKSFKLTTDAQENILYIHNTIYDTTGKRFSIFKSYLKKLTLLIFI